MTIADLNAKMKNAARALTTAQLIEAVKTLGGGRLETAENMTRATLIDVYEEREGMAAADALMDQIGL